jgi:hypothetical protein
MRAGEMALPPADRDLSFVWPNHAAENANERRFAGAILADKRVDLARHHLETDAIKRRRRPEPFANVLGAGRYVIHAQPLSPELRDGITERQKPSMSGNRVAAILMPHFC